VNPRSPLTYYRRHKRSALLQIALVSLATVGLFVLVGVLDAIPLRANVSYLTRLSRVIPTARALDPGTVSRIQTHPDVVRVIPDNGLRISLPSLIGTDSQRLLGVSPQDAQVLLQHCGVRLKEGRMLRPRTNEIVLSEEVARALDLALGSEIGRELDQGYYGAIPVPLVLVGILEGDPEVNAGPSVRVGFVSAEFLNSHEMYAPRATSLLVVAKAGRTAAVGDFLETAISSKYAGVETFGLLVRTYSMARTVLYVIFGVVNSVVAVAVAFVVGIVNRIAMAKRLREFGLLNALGFPKTGLIRRLTLETATVAGIGCLIGLGLALVIMSWLKNSVFHALGMELNLLNLAPFCFVSPIPLIVVALTFLSIRRTLARLDAVAIVERGKLSEEPRGRRAVRRSTARPLSSLTFYLRHRRRGLLMILSTALMVLGIAFPVFLLSAMMSAVRPEHEYLQQVSEMYLLGRPELNSGIVAQIKSQPAVARTVPAISLGIQMVLPPGGGTEANIYGVSESDLPILLELYGMRVKEGRLPRPRSNEIVLSAATAANRGLHLGDVIGGETDSGDVLIVDNLPTEMVVVGVLSPGRPWIGFASYEYLHSHELTSSRVVYLFIPHEGQKQALDSWLEEHVDPGQAHIITHPLREREHREMTTSTILTFTLLECMIAGVAAIALATLNHVFFTQRGEEFGILNAIGRSRRWLVWRTMKETGSVVGVGWVLGAVLCGIGLFGMRILVYAPRGLDLNFFSPAPWLLTLSVPLAVALAGAGTITWMLSKLDPVSIVERRA
jgi:lipoprotein-releasing system permease protein